MSGQSHLPSLSFILTVHNEGNEVRKTIENIKQNVMHSEIIVVDDASTDGSCIGLGDDVKVLCNYERFGVMRGMNKGASVANGDVLVHTDGHIRLIDEEVSIEDAATLALDKSAMVSPAQGDFVDEAGSGCKSARWYYSEMDFDELGLLKIKRYANRTKSPYQRVIGPPGFYVTPRDTFFHKLGMFSPYMGRWGWVELGVAIRAWFADVPILSVPDFVVAHKFKPAFSYEVSWSRDIFVNMCQTHLICFDDDTYKQVWEPKLKLHRYYEEVKELIFNDEVVMDHEKFIDNYKVKSDNDFFLTFQRTR